MLKTHVLICSLIYFLALCDDSTHHDHVHIEYESLIVHDDRQELMI